MAATTLRPLNLNLRREITDRWTEYEDKSFGAFRSVQLLERIAKIATYVLEMFQHKSASYTKELAGKFGTYTAVAALPRLPSVTFKAKKAIENWMVPPASANVGRVRDSMEKIKTVADCIATYCYSALVFGCDASFKTMAEVHSLVCDTVDLATAAQDWSEAKQLKNQIARHGNLEGTYLTAAVETMREAVIRIAKAVAGVVGNTLTLISYVFSANPLLAPIGFTLLGLAGTVSAIADQGFKDAASGEIFSYADMRDFNVQLAGI